MENPDPAAAVAASSVLRIERQVLHEAVAARLRDLIIEGHLEAGARLNERLLCAQLHISRTPLREAFKVLATEGLIALLPNRGAQVVKMGREEVEHTFDVMGALEGLSGQLACRHITESELAAIRELQRRMAACHRKRDLPGYYRLNRAIHERINEAARNPVLTRVYRAVNARLHALRFRSNFDRAKWDAALAEHEQMLVALDKRDGERMRRILVEHLAKKCAAAVLAVMGPEPVAVAAPGETAARGGRENKRARSPRRSPLPGAARPQARIAR
ncbi:MAG TPA: GntR family transcriptional regulator [Burkholderiaceae bacterium]|nr:GntR family transcriptional regulator [Burkholderiaceae bacterium]